MATEGYSAADRLLHRLAFANPGLQQALADIEDRLYARQLGEIGIDRPLFVTSLPRAGTTLLTEKLNQALLSVLNLKLTILLLEN